MLKTPEPLWVIAPVVLTLMLPPDFVMPPEQKLPLLNVALPQTLTAFAEKVLVVLTAPPATTLREEPWTVESVVLPVMVSTSLGMDTGADAGAGVADHVEAATVPVEGDVCR